MNWLGKLVQKEINKRDMVLDLGCGTMAATMDTYPAYPKTKLKCRSILGVDIWGNYLDHIKYKVNVIQYDISKPMPFFISRSFDVVLLLDVLEHLSIGHARYVLDKAEWIARKKVIVYTPAQYSDNGDNKNFANLGINEYQLHRSFIPPSMLSDHGYRVAFPEPDKNTYAVKII